MAQAVTAPSEPVHPQTRIGHIHLTVTDLERSLAFYRDLLGFEETMRYKDSAVFLSAGGYHHHLALNTWAGPEASPPPPGHTGLYHFAILYPSRRELARAVKALQQADYPLQNTSDHGVSESVYLADPDGNGVELSVDRPPETWPRDTQGNIQAGRGKVDLDELLAELEERA